MEFNIFELSKSYLCHIVFVWLVRAPNQSLTILNFWTKLTQEGYFYFKTVQMNIIIKFNIFELVWRPSFILNKEFWVFEPNLLRKCISHPKRGKLTLTANWHIRIILDAKFYLIKQTIFIFWTKFAPKLYFPSKLGKMIITAEISILFFLDQICPKMGISGSK